MTTLASIAPAERQVIRFRKARPQNFRPVVGWEGVYEVGDRGDIRRVKPNPHTTVGRFLTPYPDRYGYLKVSLRDRGRFASKMIHHMVAESFLGPRPHNMTVNHKHFDLTDNWVESLEYLSGAENSRHAARHGRRAGEHNANAKLTALSVQAIRAAYAAGGVTQVQLAQQYGVSQVQISHVVRQTYGGWRS